MLSRLYLQKVILFRTQCYLHNVERFMLGWLFISCKANKTLPAAAHSGFRDELSVVLYCKYICTLLHAALCRIMSEHGSAGVRAHGIRPREH